MSPGGLVRRYPVLAIRDFRLLLADRLIAPASAGFSLVGVSFAVLRATNSATDLSYVLAAQIAPALVFALIGGVAADRFPPQRVIIAANLMMALGEGTFGVLVLTGHPPLWAMMGLEALTGTGIAIFYPASQALLPRLVPRGLLQEASAISRLAMNTGQMSGAAVAGLLVAATGPGRPCCCAVSAWSARCRCCCPSGPGGKACGPTGPTARPARTCSENYARAGRSSGRTPGCG